jgi:hypothetical protein
MISKTAEKRAAPFQKDLADGERLQEDWGNEETVCEPQTW